MIRDNIIQTMFLNTLLAYWLWPEDSAKSRTLGVVANAVWYVVKNVDKYMHCLELIDFCIGCNYTTMRLSVCV